MFGFHGFVHIYYKCYQLHLVELLRSVHKVVGIVLVLVLVAVGTFVPMLMLVVLSRTRVDDSRVLVPGLGMVDSVVLSARSSLSSVLELALARARSGGRPLEQLSDPPPGGSHVVALGGAPELPSSTPRKRRAVGSVLLYNALGET
jgi:hypothetical protein